ncbi:MAG TPA: MATE family efflux transporter [Steroidobacteraceae bacterium]|nr:MATE family efflux transporter [Steroidobacteraceae bacterium]
MSTATPSQLAPSGLPAQRADAAGVAHVDLRAVLALALPLVANSAVQTLLNLTDLWFIGHISTTALAAVGAVNWLVIAVVMLLAGTGMAVQTTVAQAYGARRYARAAQATWSGLWGILCVAPLFVAVAFSSRYILAPFGIDPHITRTAGQFWIPRVAGAPLGVAVWGALGFFNGIGRPRTTVVITLIVACLNVVLNWLFIFTLGLGVAGSGWASTCAQGVGLVSALVIFLSGRYRREYRSHLMWRPRAALLWMQFRLGFPMGLTGASDLIGVSLFQLMQVRVGAVAGAATQLVFVATAIAYMPGVGVAQAATTLVGQSIGAGSRAWAMRVGTYVTVMAGLLMGGIGLVLAAVGPWTLPLLLTSADPAAAQVVRQGTTLLWFAAAYQFFDGLNIASSYCLRGAGDTLVPGVLVLLLSWFGFVPLAHILTFAPGGGFIPHLPQLGYGAAGGWVAMIIYVLLLGSVLYGRWRSGIWQKIRLQA